MFRLIPYTAEERQCWNDAVDQARNGTFLLKREYMDYHADRFTDRSIIIKDDKDKTVALFAAAVPAGHEDGDTVTAHAGLTYGGLIMSPRLGVPQVLEIMQNISSYFRGMGYKQLVYRAVPHIFHRLPAEDDVYALFHEGARLTGCMISSSIRRGQPRDITDMTRRNIQRAVRDGVIVSEDTDWAGFHAMLSDALAERHGVTPVHTLEELIKLASRFPENIKLKTARDRSGELLAGAVLYITDTCTHTQYISSTERGRHMRAVDLLLDTVIRQAQTEWVDLGTSCLDGGHILNTGLINQKYGFGLRGTTYSTYTLDL